MIKLQYKLMDLALKYWHKQDKIDKKNDKYGAVKWLKNDETGSMIIITRGEYSKQLIDFVNNLTP